MRKLQPGDCLSPSQLHVSDVPQEITSMREGGGGGGVGDLGSEGGVLRNERDHLWNVPCLNLLTWGGCN